MGEELAKNIVEVWLKTGFEGGRHERRVQKISLIEAREAVYQRDVRGDSLKEPEEPLEAKPHAIANAGGHPLKELHEPSKTSQGERRQEPEGEKPGRRHGPDRYGSEQHGLEQYGPEQFGAQQFEQERYGPEGAPLPDLSRIKADLASACEDLLSVADLEPGQILVVGCSTSEIKGEKIGKGSSVEIAGAVLDVLLDVTSKNGLYLAIQGCEHINRSLVVEKEVMKRYGLEEVSVYPVLHAGGALAALAMDRFKNPVTVESIRAHAGIDIGDTLIGMHLRPVAVPVRSQVKKIGHANLVMARTRPKLVGGARAQYRGVREK
ncbi:MAG TPA: TIGR01440 family protein [Clostridia bacterium]|nr:TIGR01440 family protein [Clostridia bacterium]